MEKHAIYPTTFHSWRNKYKSMDEEVFAHGMSLRHLQEIRRIEMENDLLKKIKVAKEQEVKFKDGLLKKKYTLMKKNSHALYYSLDEKGYCTDFLRCKQTLILSQRKTAIWSLRQGGWKVLL